MVRSTIFFDLTYLTRKPPDDRKRFTAWAEKVRSAIEPLVDKVYRNPIPDFLIDLDSPKLADLVQVIEKLRKQKVCKAGSGHIEERPVDDEGAPVEWFELEPKTEFNEGRGPHKREWPALNRYEWPVTGADAHRPGTHTALMTCAYVSERFKALIEQQELTGVEFLWVPDAGKYRAPQWYLPVAHSPLGRGLDHPWFDPSKFVVGERDRTDYDQPIDPLWRYGVTGFVFGDQFRPDAGYGDPVKDRLLSFFEPGQLCVNSYRRVLRQHLPDTDFAYAWRARGSRERALCYNRRTRDLLLDAKLVKEDELIGVQVLDEPYPAAEVLDDLPGGPAGPGPAYTAEELAEIRPELDRWWEQFAAEPKPVRQPSLKRSLVLLKARKREEPELFARPAKPKAIEAASQALPAPLPTAWEKVLRVTNGGRIENCPLADSEACEIVSVEELAEFESHRLEVARCMDGDFPAHLLHVVRSELDDFICLDPTTVTDSGECRVVLISHETMEVEQEWDTVAAFLEDLLEEGED